MHNVSKYLPDTMISGGLALITFFISKSAHRNVYYVTKFGDQLHKTENIYRGDTPVLIALAVFLIAFGISIAIRRYCELNHKNK